MSAPVDHRLPVDPPDEIADRVRLPLLDLVTASALDEDYRHVADRRAQERAAAGDGTGGEDDSEATGSPAPRRTAAAVVVAVFGLLIVTAAVQTSRDAEVAEEGREELIAQINDRRDDQRAAQRTIGDLREGNVTLSDAFDEVLSAERAASARLLELEGITGYAAVTGPGVRARVDDSPDGSSDGIVRDEDLAILVNGLWSAGAEAISVNGERLTALTPIRNVNGAIHVRTVPLSPPYTVLAVGNPNTLQSRFVETSSGVAWYSLVNSFGLVSEIENATGLSLPASPGPMIRSATRLEDDDATKMEEAP